MFSLESISSLCQLCFCHVEAKHKECGAFCNPPRSLKRPWKVYKYSRLTLPAHAALFWTATVDGAESAMRSLITREFRATVLKIENAILSCWPILSLLSLLPMLSSWKFWARLPENFCGFQYRLFFDFLIQLIYANDLVLNFFPQQKNCVLSLPNVCLSRV